MNSERPVYPLLTSDGVTAVRQRLAADHRHFYHFTLDCYLASIKRLGLDPSFESDESRTGRLRNPGKAIRYCTESTCGLDAGFSAVRGSDLAAKNKRVLLRTKATYLLDRLFGLDHSFGDMAAEAELALKSNQLELSANEFILLVTKFGVISCYDVIRPNELEICLDDVATFCKSLSGRFAPLLANP